MIHLILELERYQCTFYQSLMVEEQMRLVLGQHHVFDSVVGWKEAHLVHKNSCHLSLCFLLEQMEKQN